MASLLCSVCGEEHGRISLVCDPCLQELQAAPESLEPKKQWILGTETQLRVKANEEWAKIRAEKGLESETCTAAHPCGNCEYCCYGQA